MMAYKRRRLAAVDIGTNSVLMLVAERNEDGTLKVHGDFSHVTRLGEGLRNSKMISPAGLDRTVSALKDFANKAKELSADELMVTATAAVREASNQQEILKHASDAVGTEVEVIAPNEEARLTYISATTEAGGDDPSMVVDIGGGSTEITWGIGPRFDGGRSLDLGTIKLIEGPLQGNPPTKESIEAARREIDLRLSRVTPLTALEHYYGTAGSFTHLASIDLKLEKYHCTKVSGHSLDVNEVTAWIDRFSTMSTEEISKLPGADARRADVLLAGTLIIERLLTKFGNKSFAVCDRGVRYGKIFDKLRGFTPPILFN